MVTTYRIEAGGYRAEVVPTGAALRMCEFEHDGPARALTETWPAGSPPPLAAGVVLAPWPNRIRDGRFDFDGIEHQLEITEPKLHNASHGLVRKREWRLDSHEPTQVTQSIDVGLHRGWPYPMRLRVTHEVGDDGLTVTHTVTNTGSIHAPFGLGMHSYVRVGDVPLDECRLELPAAVYLPLERERNLPTGASQPVGGTDFDFLAARTLRGVWLDTPFSALVPDADGLVRTMLRAPDGTGTVLWTEPAFRWVQVFTADPSHDQAYPGRGRALAVEPMTCPPDAFNSRIDVIVLEPGEERTMRWGMSAV